MDLIRLCLHSLYTPVGDLEGCDDWNDSNLYVAVGFEIVIRFIGIGLCNTACVDMHEENACLIGKESIFESNIIGLGELVEWSVLEQYCRMRQGPPQSY